MDIEDVEWEIDDILGKGKQRVIEYNWRTATITEPPYYVVIQNDLGKKLELDEENFSEDDWEKIIQYINDKREIDLKVDMIEYLEEKFQKKYGKKPEIDFDSDYWTYIEVDNKRYLVKDPEPIEHIQFINVTGSFEVWKFNFADKYRLEEI